MNLPDEILTQMPEQDDSENELIRIIIPETPADGAENDIMNRNVFGNIYFPRNAKQPTTEDAVKWSCADIDNIKDSPITEW